MKVFTVIAFIYLYKVRKLLMKLFLFLNICNISHEFLSLTNTHFSSSHKIAHQTRNIQNIQEIFLFLTNCSLEYLVDE